MQVAPEPAWYADWRLLALTSVPSRRGGPYNWTTATQHLTTRVGENPGVYHRVTERLKSDGSSKDCQIQVCVYEPSVFSLDMPDVISTLYKNKGEGEEEDGRGASRSEFEVDDMLNTISFRYVLNRWFHKRACYCGARSSRLFHTCCVYNHAPVPVHSHLMHLLETCSVLSALIAVNEAPYIRFSASKHAERLAQLLYKQMKLYRDANPSWTPTGYTRVSYAV